jgi:NTE family protein
LKASHQNLTSLFLVLASIALATSLYAQVQQPDSDPRQTIGLALGGGAAKGFAHIGILEWFEENRIPVDYVVGTSMGGLVGGAYATGMSASDIRILIRNVDWDVLFLGEAPYELKDFRRKEDSREIPSKIEFGLKGGFRLPGGMDPGHQVGLLLSRIALPYSTVESFDDLPIPFRCVAVDLDDAVDLPLSDGSLAQALRATMAIPGVFTPVERDEVLLADGGLLNNVPADVARSMGPDVVIAVDVSNQPAERGKLNSLLDNASLAIDVMMRADTRETLKEADLVIAPALGKLGSMSWRQSDAIADLGYEAAAAMSEELRQYSVSEDAWERHLDRRRTRALSAHFTPQFLQIEGVREELVPRVEEALQGHLNRLIDPEELERDLTLLTGTRWFESIRYEAVETDNAVGLRIVAQETQHGPPFLRLAVGLSTEADTLNFSFGGRLTLLSPKKKGYEIRTDFTLGLTNAIGFELYKPFLGRLFVAPRADASQIRDNIYVDDELLATSKQRRGAVGVDLGVAAGYRSEIRFGYDIAHISQKIQVGDPLLPEAEGREQRLRLRWIFDGHDQPIVPTKGIRTTVIGMGYVEAPDADQDFYQSVIRASFFNSWTERDRIFLSGTVGHTFEGSLPPYYEFTLGGPLRLSGFDEDEFRGRNALLAQFGYLRTIGRLPDFVGGPIYVVGLGEVGSAYEKLDQADYHFSGTGGILMESALGPVFLGIAVGDDGSTRFLFSLGRFVHN